MGRILKNGELKIYVEGPLEEVSTRSDGKTERRLIYYKFHFPNNKNSARIDLWRSEENPQTVEIGLHRLVGEFRGFGQVFFNFIHNDPHLKKFGVEKISITRNLAHNLSFFAHMGYSHETAEQRAIFLKALNQQWPKDIPKSETENLGSILFRFSKGRRKGPKTTLSKHL